jgi:hypothetical protein
MVLRARCQDLENQCCWWFSFGVFPRLINHQRNLAHDTYYMLLGLFL